MNTKTNASKGNSKGKLIGITGGALVVILITSIALYFNYMKNEVAKWADVVYPEVAIENINLGGKTKEEAKTAIEEAYGKAILKKSVEVKVGDKSYSMDYSKLNARYNIEETVERAFQFNKDLKVKDGYKFIKNRTGKTFNLEFTADHDYIKEFVANIAKENDKQSKSATIKFENGKKATTPEAIGYKLDQEALEKEIIGSINGNIEEKKTINAKINEDKPKVTLNDLDKINGKISTYSTNFSTSSNERAYNIELSTKAVNGTLLMPGDVFSYNEVVGERTKARGYKDAPVIVGNKVEAGTGGGICQTSSTLYQAVIRSGIKSVERYNHSLPVSYLPKGFDATVSWGGPDYKFKNTYDFPIYIEGLWVNRNIVFNIYGNNSVTNKTYDLESEVYETIQPTSKTVDDPNLPEGQVVVDSNPAQGYKVKTYLKTYENGKLINTETISNDTYQVVHGVTRKGTKKAQ